MEELLTYIKDNYPDDQELLHLATEAMINCSGLGLTTLQYTKGGYGQ